MKNVTRKAVMGMFQHYIERMRYNQQHPSFHRMAFTVPENAVRLKNG